MKKIFIASVMLFCSVFATAQEILVESFSLQETDVTANIAQSTVMDRNGKKCALIKVETTITGLTFDVGVEGVQKVVEHEGEVWLYVPAGVGRISIKKNGLTPLEDYDLGLRVESAKTYLMKLKNTSDVISQELTIKSNPATAAFLLTSVSDKEAKPFVVQNNEGKEVQILEMPLGEYKYVALAQGYNIEEGTFEITKDKDRNLSVELTPVGATSISFVGNQGGVASVGGAVANDVINELVFAPFTHKKEPNEIIVGKTKITDLSHKVHTYQGVSSAVGMKGLLNYDFVANATQSDGIIDVMGLGEGNPLPKAWTDRGLNFSLTVDQWIDKLEELGFSLKNEFTINAGMGIKLSYSILMPADNKYGFVLLYKNRNKVTVPFIGSKEALDVTLKMLNPQQ